MIKNNDSWGNSPGLVINNFSPHSSLKIPDFIIFIRPGKCQTPPSRPGGKRRSSPSSNPTQLWELGQPLNQLLVHDYSYPVHSVITIRSIPRKESIHRVLPPWRGSPVYSGRFYPCTGSACVRSARSLLYVDYPIPAIWKIKPQISFRPLSLSPLTFPISSFSTGLST